MRGVRKSVLVICGAVLSLLALLIGWGAGVVVPGGHEPRYQQPDRLLPTGSDPRQPLVQILEANGNLEAWHRLKAIRIRLSFGGAAFRLRFAEPDPVPRWIELHLDEPKVEFEAFPTSGRRGVFTPEQVWIEDQTGSVLAALHDPRTTLTTSWRRQLWWDDLDLLYFAGYAVWNYFQGPFLLVREGIRIERVAAPVETGVGPGMALAVSFESSIPTHSPEQTFYYDAAGRQIRHDYRPLAFAGWANASLYTTRFREHGGFRVPELRFVVPRGADPASASTPVLVWIEVHEYLPY